HDPLLEERETRPVPEKAGDLDRQRLLQRPQLLWVPAQIARVGLDSRQSQGPDPHQKTSSEIRLLVTPQVEPLPFDEVAVDRFPGVIGFGSYAHDRARTAAKYRFQLQKGQMTGSVTESVTPGGGGGASGEPRTGS